MYLYWSQYPRVAACYWPVLDSGSGKFFFSMSSSAPASEASQASLTSPASPALYFPNPDELVVRVQLFGIMLCVVVSL